jgi:hypothetical protein
MDTSNIDTVSSAYYGYCLFEYASNSQAPDRVRVDEIIQRALEDPAHAESILAELSFLKYGTKPAYLSDDEFKSLKALYDFVEEFPPNHINDLKYCLNELLTKKHTEFSYVPGHACPMVTIDCNIAITLSQLHTDMGFWK